MSKTTKKLDPKTRRIIDIVITSLEALVVIVCILVSVLVWVGVADNPEDRNLNWFAIQTASMVGDNPDSLNPGDIAITKKVAQQDIKVGDVIAFKAIITDTTGQKHQTVVTHRVVGITAEGAYRTKGDNPLAMVDSAPVEYSEVIGRYSGKIKGLGKVILWLQGFEKVDTPLGIGYQATGNTAQFLVIIIPLILLFAYNGYVVVKYIMDARAKKIREATLAEANAAGIEDQEAIKRAALVEFMQQQGMSADEIDAYFAQNAAPTADSEQPDETPAQDTGDTTDNS